VKNDFDVEFENFLNSYIEILTKRIFKNFGVKNISRFGFIIKSVLTEKDELLSEVSKIIETRKGIDDSLSLRFNVITKKPLKLPKFVTEDYDNEIVTYDKANTESPLNLTVDYQKYFKPELNIIEDAPQDFGTFCKNTLQVFNETYLKG